VALRPGWVSVEVRNIAGIVTWLMNGTIVAQYTNTTAYASGNIMVATMTQWRFRRNPPTLPSLTICGSKWRPPP